MGGSSFFSDITDDTIAVHSRGHRCGGRAAVPGECGAGGLLRGAAGAEHESQLCPDDSPGGVGRSAVRGGAGAEGARP